MNYAPVFIPTLNRYSHFKQCLDSLEVCSGAEYTDVYIGLDYPPSEMYVDGWVKIDGYLREKEQKHGFHSLIVFRREHNCGISSPESNSALLYRHVSSISDKFIFSEDDNVFSPNFLEYINGGLDKYENDDSVFAIVGYAHPYHFKCEDNNHYRHNTDMSAWGYGAWFHKYNQFVSYVMNQGFRKDFSFRNVLKFRKHGWLRLFDFVHYSYHKGYTWITDGVISAYMVVNEKYAITPTISKVRNIGWDESGNSFKKGVKGFEAISERHIFQQIDPERHFEYVGNDTTYMDYNNHIAAIESDGYMSFGQFLVKLWRSFFKMPQ